MDGIDKLDTMEDWKVLGRSIEIARLLAMNVHMAHVFYGGDDQQALMAKVERVIRDHVRGSA